MESLLADLGDEVQDIYEETFSLFSQTSSLENLGLLDPKLATLELAIAGRDFTITQSPGSLQSTRREGTTGAAVWQTSVRVAEWLASPINILFAGGLLESSSTVLELGSGISGVVPCVLGPKVGTIIATDQSHLLKLLRENITGNTVRAPARPSKHRAVRKSTTAEGSGANNIRVVPLDWEEDDASKVLTSHGLSDGVVDVIFANDCIYNYALIEPLMQTCVDICRLRSLRDQVRSDDEHERAPTVCIIAQQLRQAEVFEQWLQTTLKWFRVWRMPNEMLTEGLKDGSGFAIHLCILRSSAGGDY